MPPILGLDIGAHSARAAYLIASPAVSGIPTREVRYVADAYGDTSLPSVVRYTLHGAEVGYYPDRFQVTNWENSVRGCARFIGRYAQVPATVLADATCTVAEREGRAHFNLLYAEAFPEDLYAQLVATLVENARSTFDAPVRDVVLSVPATADNFFRVRVKSAVEALGLRVRRLINQPTAALLAALQTKAHRIPNGLVAVIDAGAGKTDVSLVHKDGTKLTVRATRGDAHLGGDDCIRRVAQALAARFARYDGVDPFTHGSPVARLGLQHAATEAFHALSTAHQTLVVLDHGAGFGRDLLSTVRRTDVERWIQPELARVRQLIAGALHDAHARPSELSAVLITGGLTHVPALRAAIAEACACAPDALLCPNPLGLVAHGAAVQAAMLAGDVEGAVWDVTPYPLGIAAWDEDETWALSTIIPANTPVPTAPHTQQYYTHDRNQRVCKLQILQYSGEPTNAKIAPQACEMLGTWEFTGLHPKPGDRAAFKVTFQIDADGILALEARENDHDHRLAARITQWG